jgi:hypothetical protein
MLSNKIRFSSFILKFNIAYRSHQPFVDIKNVTNSIYSFTLALARDNLIEFFFFYTQTITRRRVIRIFFRYAPNQKLLFQKIQLMWQNNCLSEQQFLGWLKRKSSLAFPILFVKWSPFQIITDRQLLYLRFRYPQLRYLGGKIIAQILP